MLPAQKSAKIYPFPVRARTTVEAGRFETRSSAEFRASRAAEVLSGSGWYHEAAMQDALRPSKH